MSNFKLAWKAFWSIFKDDAKAQAWEALNSAAQLPQAQADAKKTDTAEKAQPAPAKPAQNPAENALHLLAILQREARFIDFLQESLDGYDDATVGSVSRKIHDDCQKTLDKYFSIVPVMQEDEQSQVEIPADFDPRRIKLTGNAGAPPYKGTLQHKGWKAEKQDMPQRNSAQDASIICPAEVEI